MISILIIVLLIYIVVGGVCYINELIDGDIEYRYPNLGKRALLCVLCGPIAWITKLFLFAFSGIICLWECTIDPLIDWLREE